MKIWCDACNNTEASVFCSADEAALCDDCDLKIHQANKLASKHQRFSLLQPSSSSSHAPLCDICQERKALLFCQQDRAILCRDCDVTIHTANELTKKHNRFLLTGAKLSLLSSTKNMEKSGSVPDLGSRSLNTKRAFMSDSSQASSHQFKSISQQHTVNNQQISGEGGLISSISEYLMETLPGWQVEDLLDSSSDPVGIYKDFDDDDDLLFLNTDFESRISSYENKGLWVPEAQNVLQQPSPLHSGICGMNTIEGIKGKVSRKVSRKNKDDGFTVPQIIPQSKSSKKSRCIL